MKARNRKKRRLQTSAIREYHEPGARRDLNRTEAKWGIKLGELDDGRKQTRSASIYVLLTGHGMDRVRWLKGIKSEQIAMTK